MAMLEPFHANFDGVDTAILMALQGMVSVACLLHAREPSRSRTEWAYPVRAAHHNRPLSVIRDSFGGTNNIPHASISLIWGSSDNTELA
jgi:hypothetical protein